MLFEAGMEAAELLASSSSASLPAGFCSVPQATAPYMTHKYVYTKRPQTHCRLQSVGSTRVALEKLPNSQLDLMRSHWNTLERAADGDPKHLKSGTSVHGTY